MTASKHREPHFMASDAVRDIVIGMSDGLTVPFAIAAGMSGGIAYVYDEDSSFKERCNTDMVVLESLSEEDKAAVRSLLHNHFTYTASSKAKAILDDFAKSAKKMVKVMPIEYKRILEGIKVEEGLELLEVSDG